MESIYAKYNTHKLTCTKYMFAPQSRPVNVDPRFVGNQQNIDFIGLCCIDFIGRYVCDDYSQLVSVCVCVDRFRSIAMLKTASTLSDIKHAWIASMCTDYTKKGHSNQPAVESAVWSAVSVSAIRKHHTAYFIHGRTMHKHICM